MTRYRNLLSTAALGAALTTIGAFAPPNASPFAARNCNWRSVATASVANEVLLRLSAKDDGDDGGGNFPSDRYSRAFAHNEARTSVRHLLTQRTVQSFLFLLQQCRDDHTVGWIEKFGDVGGLLTFHGTGAFNLTRFPKWDTLFLEMIEQPKESIAVRVKSRSGVGGGGRCGRGNSYFDSLSSSPAETGAAKEAKSMPSKEEKVDDSSSKAKFSGIGGSYLDAISSPPARRKLVPKRKLVPSASSTMKGMNIGDRPKKTESSAASDTKKKVSPNRGAGASYLDALSSDKPAARKSPSTLPAKKPSGGMGVGGSYLDALSSAKPEKPSKVYEPNKEDYAGEKFVEFNVDIDPVSLVNRMITVREKIAREWAKDLKAFVYANSAVLENYHDAMLAERDLEEKESKAKVEEKTTTEEMDIAAAKDGDDDDVAADALADESDVVEGDVADDHSVSYEKLSMLDTISFEPNSSPLRKANFDLLCLLVTQEAIHRVLREYQMMGDDKEVPFAFLKQFYLDRIDAVFDGSGPFGRQDEFVQGLLMASPTIVTTEDGKVGLNDPQRIANKIIRMRETVAKEWRDLMKDVPQQQMELRKALLGKQIEKSIFSEITCSKNVEESKPTEVIEGGDFE